ncbi:hypothetical protein Nepgr_021693 [Nepenthes gracilis]|uniref:Transmembrane protein n=1 Tax=Nepenthes gracilis TaxID=150966 RepID=A0AAD3SZ82_NEPGR|nr:hypothetical protein Nepgr_021693 [Nepenthes gracilis]
MEGLGILDVLARNLVVAGCFLEAWHLHTNGELMSCGFHGAIDDTMVLIYVLSTLLLVRNNVTLALILLKFWGCVAVLRYAVGCLGDSGGGFVSGGFGKWWQFLVLLWNGLCVQFHCWLFHCRRLLPTFPPCFAFEFGFLVVEWCLCEILEWV